MMTSCILQNYHNIIGQMFNDYSRFEYGYRFPTFLPTAAPTLTLTLTITLTLTLPLTMTVFTFWSEMQWAEKGVTIIIARFMVNRKGQSQVYSQSQGQLKSHPLQSTYAVTTCRSCNIISTVKGDLRQCTRIRKNKIKHRYATLTNSSSKSYSIKYMLLENYFKHKFKP